MFVLFPQTFRTTPLPETTKIIVVQKCRARSLMMGSRPSRPLFILVGVLMGVSAPVFELQLVSSFSDQSNYKHL